jgi:hypothetical protein
MRVASLSVFATVIVLASIAGIVIGGAELDLVTTAVVAFTVLIVLVVGALGLELLIRRPRRHQLKA